VPHLYYIDGYNVIHFSSRLRALLDRDFEAARDTLLDWVARFCSDSGKHVRVVFDGRGLLPGLQPSAPATPGLEVIYSADGQTADAYIERQVFESRGRKDIVVATADHGLRDLCRGMGAFTMTPDNFLATIRESLEQSRSELRHIHHDARSPRMEDHLDEETINKLRDLKERLDK
jgi:uncharacterized protein